MKTPVKKKLFDSKIGQKKKYMEIISIFKDKIISGELKLGDKIPTEAELMEQLGLSRTPIREAIKILEAIGIIEIKRGDGMFLRGTTLNMNLNPLIMSMILQSGNIKALIEFRQYFEHMIIELVWKHCTAQEYEKLVNSCNQLETSLNLDTRAWVEMDLQFHYLVLDMTHNSFIIEIGKTVYELFRSKMENIDRKISRANTITTHKLYLKVLKDKNEKDFGRLKRKIASNYSNLYSTRPHASS
ncbi:MAG: GntR family transcriptional regulator [Spirochaetales bacterium]|jgi:DNA-binding FadR family transcriptional regulator|nr:GntR family transcriptional regulator [Spirochaetales bacterium]